MSKSKIQTEMERTYQDSKEPIAPSNIDTTIQGEPVTLFIYRERTNFFFRPVGCLRETNAAPFLAAFGSEDFDFVHGLITQLANFSPRRKSPDVEGLKFAVAAVTDMAPRDPLEATTCAQLAVVHSITMMMAERLVEGIGNTDSEREEQSFTRLSRTHCILSETLSRHRRDGDQKIGRRRVVADRPRANGNASPKRQNQTYFNPESAGKDGKIGESLRTGHRRRNPDFVSCLFGPLTHMGYQESLHFVRAFVKGIRPRDSLEEQIGAQIAVVHSMAMMFAHRLTHAYDFIEIESAERSLNRLSRTFCALVGTFDHHRDCGNWTPAVVRKDFDTENAKSIVFRKASHNEVKTPGKLNGHTSA